MTLAILGAIAPPWVESIDTVAVACKGCGTMVHWAKTTKGRRAPLVRVGNEWRSHHADCPKADQFRRKERT